MMMNTVSKVNKPILNGLVLAGGKSVRMGRDKGKISWHGKEQRYYLADLLKLYCSNVFISCTSEQGYEICSSYDIIPDSFTDLGPCGAILSAFNLFADCAWLTVACDLPLMDTNTLSLLIKNRDAYAMATTFKSPIDNLPETVATIWEPVSYKIILDSLSQGYYSLRKTLMNNEVNIISPENPEALINVNTMQEFEKVQQFLGEKHT